MVISNNAISGDPLRAAFRALMKLGGGRIKDVPYKRAIGDEAQDRYKVE
jgi:hypothetical protein